MPIMPSSTVFRIFEDLDDKDVFLRLRSAALSGESRNFILEFSETFARCAFNVDKDGFCKHLDNRTATVKVQLGR